MSKNGRYIASALLLTLSIARCGPIASSVDKNALRVSPGPGGGSLGGTAGKLHKYVIQTGSSSYSVDSINLAALGISSSTRSVTLSQDQVSAFIANHGVAVALGFSATAPTTTIYDVIVPAGVDPGAFSSTFSPSGTTLTLAPAGTVSPQLWSDVSSGLQGITLEFN